MAAYSSSSSSRFVHSHSSSSFCHGCPFLTVPYICSHLFSPNTPPSSQQGRLPSHRSLSLVLKALIHENRIAGVFHQLSSVKHLLLPDLPYPLLNEIKKRMGGFASQKNEETGEITDIAPSQVDEESEQSKELMELWNDPSPWSIENSPSSVHQSFKKKCELPITISREESSPVLNHYKALNIDDTDLKLGETMLFPRCSWPRDEGKPVRLDVSYLQSSPSDTKFAESPESPRINRFQADEIQEMGRARCAWPRSVPSIFSQTSDQGCEIKVQSETMNLSSSNSPQSSSVSETELSDGHGILRINKGRFVSEVRINQSSHNGAAISKEWAAPRCAWPRSPGSKVHPVDKCANSSAETTVVDGGAKCAWPRVRSKATAQVSANCITDSDSSISLTEEIEGQLAAGPRCAWPKPGNTGITALEEKKRGNLDQASASPKDFPRRMLTTSVGLSLMNFLLVAQGASALAKPDDFLQEMGVTSARGGKHVPNGRVLSVR